MKFTMAWIVILLMSSVVLFGNSVGAKKNEDALLKKLDHLLNAAHVTEKREQKIQKKNVQCGDSTSLRSGDITSPGYPGNYPSNENCVYTIIVAGTADINIEFRVLDIEYETNCGYDAVFLPQPFGPDLRVCGREPTRHVYNIQDVTGEYSIRFKSDVDEERQGFLLHYTVDGGESHPEPNHNGVDMTTVLGKLNELYVHAQEVAIVIRQQIRNVPNK